MAVKRRVLLLGFVFALCLGIAVYFRIWAIDSTFSSVDDREELRQQFERANLEAMDESAEWRMKFDSEVEKSRQCQEELMKVKIAIASANRRLSLVQKENISLKKRVESLTMKIEAKEHHCNCSQSLTQQP